MTIQNQRKLQLVEAAVHEIGAAGTLNVSVSQIARRAGVSSALAFHYFGGKDALFLGAMRHVLAIYGAEVRGALRRAQSPAERIAAVVWPNFTPTNFQAETISAWLNFYVMAQNSEPARRLLQLYHRRLQSNLQHAMRPVIGARAVDAATRIGALIDGLYLRAVHDPERFSGVRAAHIVLDAVALETGIEIARAAQ